jgi:hypothetical protein
VLSPASTAVGEKELPGNVEESRSVYLDDYNGYSTDLSQLLGEIGRAISAQKEPEFTQNDHSSSETDSFEAAVYRIMERDNSATPIFYPGVREILNPQSIQEYA